MLACPFSLEMCTKRPVTEIPAHLNFGGSRRVTPVRCGSNEMCTKRPVTAISAHLNFGERIEAYPVINNRHSMR